MCRHVAVSEESDAFSGKPGCIQRRTIFSKNFRSHLKFLGARWVSYILGTQNFTAPRYRILCYRQPGTPGFMYLSQNTHTQTYIYIYISCTHTALSANKSDNISEKLKGRFSFFHDIVRRQFITYVSGQRVVPISRSQDVERSKESSWKFDYSVNAT